MYIYTHARSCLYSASNYNTGKCKNCIFHELCMLPIPLICSLYVPLGMVTERGRARDPQLLLKQSALLNRLGFFSRTSLQQQSTDSLSPFKEILLRNIQEGSMGAVGKRGDQGHEEERSATPPTNPKPKNAFPVSNPDLVATWWLCKVRPL